MVRSITNQVSSTPSQTAVDADLTGTSAAPASRG